MRVDAEAASEKAVSQYSISIFHDVNLSMISVRAFACLYIQVQVDICTCIYTGVVPVCCLRAAVAVPGRRRPWTNNTSLSVFGRLSKINPVSSGRNSGTKTIVIAH